MTHNTKSHIPPPKDTFPAQSEPATPIQTADPSFWVQLTVGLIGTFAFMQVYSVQSILPVLMTNFNITEVEIGLLVGATVFGIALMSPVAGIFSDSIGRKSVIVGSIIALAIPTALMSIAPSVEVMSLLRLIQGVSVPGITVVAMAYIGEEYSGRTLTKLMSFYVSGCVLGGFSGRFFLGHLHELIGWRDGFLVMGVVTLSGAFWVAKILPASRQFVANPNVKSGLGILKQHLSNRYIVSACLLGSCVLFTLVGCFTFINLHLADKPYQLTTGQLANIFLLYLIGMVVTPVSSKLLYRFGSSKTVILAVMFSIIGMSITLAVQIWVIIIGLAIMSTGVFITQSATISYIAVNVKQGRSLASGLYYMCYYAGGSLGAWACAWAYQFSEWQAVVVLILCVQILALIIASKLISKAD